MTGLDKVWRREHASASKQYGQALVEALIAVSALLVLWVAITWLAHYQDAALSATHASRYAAFIGTRSEAGVDSPSLPGLVAPFFTGSAYRWGDRTGKQLIEFHENVKVSWRRSTPLGSAAQPGRDNLAAITLRGDWNVADLGKLKSVVDLTFHNDKDATPFVARGRLGLDVFDRGYPALLRSTTILTGAGHAASDKGTQARVGVSGLAWSAAYRASHAAAEAVISRATVVEQGWGRPAADLDWLSPWKSYVPEQFLTTYGAGRGD